MLSLVALLVAGMVPLASRTLGPDIAQSICRSVYTALTADEEGAEEYCGPGQQPGDSAAPEDPPESAAPTEQDFVPALCQVQADTRSQGLHGMAVVFYDGETTITRIEYADGSVWFIAEPWGHGVGAAGGFGAAAPIGAIGKAPVFLGGWLEGEGAYEWGHSLVWTFDENESDQAEAFEQELREETSIGSNPFSQLWNSVTGLFGGDSDPQLSREPAMEIDMQGGSGTIAAGPELVVYPVAYAAPEWLELDGGAVRTTRTDHGGSLYPDAGGQDVTSVNHQLTGSVTADRDIVIGAGAGLGWSAGIRSDRTEDGELQGIFLNASFDMEGHFKASNPFGVGARRWHALEPTASYESGRGVVQNTYVYVAFDNEEEREIGEEFLRQNGGWAGTFNYFWSTALGDHAFLEQDPGPDADPWEQLLYDKALAWQTTSSSDSTSASLGVAGQIVGQFPVGFNAPFSAGWNSASDALTTQRAWHLGAPGEDGTRAQVPYDDCLG